MARKRFRTICGVVCFLGVVLMLSTAGESDHGSITVGRTIIQLIVGLAMFAGGGFLGGFMQ